MKKLLFKLFRKQIERRAQEISKDRMTGRISAHDACVKQAPVDCRVYLISDEDNDKVTDALGINDKARERLEDALGDSVQGGVSFVAAMEKASTYCKHPNELAFVAFQIGKYAEKQASVAVGMLGGGVPGLPPGIMGELLQAYLKHKKENGDK